MPLITTKDGRIVIKKAESMMVVPYVYDNNVESHVLGSSVYDISSIIGDSITIEQSEGEKVRKTNEFVSEPLLETSFGSRFGFTAQCLDLQNSILKAIFCAMTGSGKYGAVEGAAAFNDDYVLQYALIRIRVKDASSPDVILPMVKMNTRLLLNQLKSRGSQGNIGGTALSKKVAVEDNIGGQGGLLQFSVPATNSVTYTPYTPLLFVPKTNTPLFHHHTDGDYEYYSVVDFSTGHVAHNIEVEIGSGSWHYFTN